MRNPIEPKDSLEAHSDVPDTVRTVTTLASPDGLGPTC